MAFKCRPADLDFLERAPVRFVNEIELDAPPARVFAIFEDAAAWPQWFKEIVTVEWTSPRPYGVGTTRTVTLTTVTVKEYFFVWEQDQHFAFYFTEISLPIAKALVEDYRLEDLGENRCKFIYTVGLEPTVWLRLGGSLVLKVYGKMFRQATENLATYVRAQDLSDPSTTVR
jgi:hypothetical protein